MKYTIVIGVSSGIAAYKIVDLIKILKYKNIEIEVIMTNTAVKIFGVEMFEKAAGKKVYTDLVPDGFDYREVLKKREVEHIKLADAASLFVIAPATANIIGKIAAGIADDFLTTTILATEAPVLVCPSMNIHMWENPIVQKNLDELKKLGYFILHPDSGQLACGYEGVGRLAHPQKIAEEILRLLYEKEKLKGKKIIITAGGTSEPIDAVRTITNRASGKMGTAIAQECYLRGADVLLLKSKTAVGTNAPQDTSGVASWKFDPGSLLRELDPGSYRGHDSPDGGVIKIEIFETAKNLEELIKKYIKNYDILFHTAAVSDFLPEKIIDKKLDSQKPVVLKLRPAPKILHQIKSWNKKIKLVGFKAVYKLEEKELIDAGIKKLKESNSDYIIVNDVGKEGVGFGVDTNEVYIVSPKGFLVKIPKASKKEVARKILDYIFR
ncbi:bifunctional phosphopantothenoylcysteine decarboxylase/phosphopantothenate--cysteine ligase CoaBC [Candidatus Gottesmanbacteria bacterium]|nr:bifunctional phosphopantothenoylcysteine decarboxylase/phosphopantothenate--cysteine ligase CoaBC [Candidatus Gottesmanbacteria bacterium]